MPLPITSAPSFPELSGYTLSGYTLVEQLYLGSRTAVYRAVEGHSQKSVVIKVLRREYPSFGELVQFRNQYTITQNLNIPGIVRPVSLEVLGNGSALVMEDTQGIPLGKYAQQQPLTLTDVLAIAIQITETLHDLSQHRIVHKDIKPANILIHPDSKQVKLIDFSIASLLPKETQEVQSPNTLEGTLAYLAPEQTGRMNRGIDYRADFYALGVTLYQLLAGRLPFESADPLELVHCHIAKMPVPLNQASAHVPEKVAAIVAKLMAKNAEDRYQSALGLKHDLERCLISWKETGEITDFKLAERDLSDRFLIPEKLYGREAEVQALLKAFERVAVGASELMLVAGFSGIGKTAVVNEVHKPIARQRGYFIKGKFDQFNRNIPLSAFVQALRNLIQQLLSESDEQLAQWQRKILAAVGENGQVLIEVIPELEQIMGQQPSIAELSGSAMQSRFNLVFQNFIEVFTTAEHPLVLFLDDLQWADLASLQLIKLLMNGKGYVLVLGAYRDNEVSPTHPFLLTVEDLKKAQTLVHTITLEPLDFDNTNQLIADTLHCSLDLAQPLSQLIIRKTQGNPFFTTQFLKALHRDGQILFDSARRYWECDIAQVNALALTDDVVEFIALQLQKLPDETQQALKLAACVGSQFDLTTLAIVAQQQPEQIATALWKALKEGLIVPMSQVYKFFQMADTAQLEVNNTVNPTYRFLHDRVQQAAYSLIPEDHRSLTQLKIGQLLLKNSSATEQEEKLFDIVGYLNQAQHLITQAAEHNQLIQLNLQAGRKAKRSTSYTAASRYLSLGIQMLSEQGSENSSEQAWEQHYDLMFALHQQQAEVEYLNGNFIQSEALIESGLHHAKSSLEKAEFYHLLIMQKSVSGHYAEAIQTGFQALKLLGVCIDRETLQTSLDQELAEIKQNLEAHAIASLIDLPEMEDPEKRMIIQLLIDLDPPTYITADFDLYMWVNVKAANFSMQYGNVPVSPKAYANYGFITGSVLGDYRSGYEFGLLALDLSQKFNHMGQRCQVSLLLGSWLSVWSRPMAGVAAINAEGYQAGLLGGEPQFAGYNLFGNICNQIFQGIPLDLILTDIQTYSIFAKNTQNQLLIDTLIGAELFIESLILTPSEKMHRSTSSITDQALIAQCQSGQTLMALSIYYIYQMQVACVQQNFAQGLAHSVAVKPILDSVVGFTTSASYYFYSSLILLNQSNQSESDWQQIQSNQAKLKNWSENCPENFLNKHVLVQAEISRVQGDIMGAIALYDRAIALSKANGYIPEEALANEFAAQFYLNWDKEKIAVSYMQEAYYSYSRWGAKRKIYDLEKDYPHLLTPILQMGKISWSASETTCSSDFVRSSHRSASQGSASSNRIANTLDLETILKASQTLSSEIQLDKLLATLLHIVIENAGANKGVLLMPHAQPESGGAQPECGEKTVDWFVEAIATVHQPAQIRSVALSDSTEIPHRLIHTVKRTQAPVVIGNAATHETLATDTYVVKHGAKSLLCTPIMQQGKLMAILYLENQVTIGAFTNDRLKVLQMLSSQFAIALENSLLYNTLEQKVAQRTETLSQTLHQLQQTQSQLIQAEKMSSLGQLIGGIAHEINNPVNFIHGNLAHVTTYTQDLIALLGLYQAELPNPSLAIAEKLKEADIDFLNRDLFAVLKSMDTGTQRIRDIVTSLRNFSRLDESEFKSVDLHSGINSALMILQSRLEATAERPEIQVIKAYGDLPLIQCSAGQFNQVFMNILTNAIDALEAQCKKAQSGNMPDNLSPCINIVTEMVADNRVKITIADNGIGISDEIQSQLFNPFFTTKPVGKGTGMGLAISYQIVTEQHHGTLICRSTASLGSQFEIEIPIL
jgi:predicted ATPase/signal transduction histidine kinase